MFQHEVQKETSRLPLILAAAVAICVIVALFTVPVAHTVPGSCTLEPAASFELKAPHAGTFDSLAVAERAVVEKGTVLGTWNTGDAQERVKTLEPAIADLQTRLKAADAPAKKRLVAAVDKAEAAAAAAQAALDKATADAAGKKAPALAAASKRMTAAQAAVVAARAAAGPPRAELEGELAKRTHELEQARSEVDHPALLAPEAGVVAGLLVKPGEPVAADATLLRIDSIESLKASVTTPEQSLERGMTAELTTGPLTHHVTLEAGGVATLDNTKHALQPGQPCSAAISGTPHPVIHF